MSSPNAKFMKENDCSLEPAMIPPSKRKIYPVRIREIELGAEEGVNQHRVKRSRSERWLFIGDDGKNKAALRKLSRIVKSSKDIREFTIRSDYDCQRISKKGLFYLAKSLKRLRSLTSIKVDLSYNEELDRYGLKYFIDVFKSLPLSLRSLCFNAFRCMHISYEIEELISALIRLPCLQKIQLQFGCCTEGGIGDKELESISKALRKTKRLKILFLNIQESWISHEGLEAFGETLNTLTFLQSLYLDLSSCHNLGNQGVKSLAQGIKGLTSLRKIDLNFQNCWGVTDFAMNFLGQALKTLTLAKNVVLDFSACNRLTDIGLENISQGLRNFASLQSLLLSVSVSENNTQEGMKSLGQALNSLKSLKSIDLYFYRYKSLNDEAIHGLCQGLKALVLLESFRLNLGDCGDKPSDTGIQYIAEVLKDTPLLKTLSLNFMLWKNMTDEGVKDFAQALKTLGLLTSLNIRFRDCENIGDFGITELCASLKALKSLQRIELYFGGCKKSSEAGKANMRQALDILPCLNSRDIYYTY